MISISSSGYIATIISAAIAGAVIGVIVTAFAMYSANRDFDSYTNQEKSDAPAE